MTALLLGASGYGLYRLDDHVTHRLGGLVIADPTPDLIARYGLEPVVRTVAAGDDGAVGTTFEEPVGPIVIEVGADAERLGLGPIHEGHWFSIVGGAHPKTARELKRVLAAKVRRNAKVREVSCSLVAKTASPSHALDMTALGPASARPLVPFVLGAVPLVALGAWLGHRGREKRPWLLPWVLATAALAFMALAGAWAMLAEALV